MMWVIISVFISGLQEAPTVTHVDYPFQTKEACEATLPNKLLDGKISYLSKDDRGLYVKTDFPQGWTTTVRCVEIWK